jgi:hypothetical protein
MTMNCLPIQWRRTLILSAAVAFAACSSSSTTNDAQVAGGSGGTTSAGSGGASAQLDAAVASTGGSADSGVGGSTTSGGGSTGTSNTGGDAAQADRPATDGTQADAPIRDSQDDSQSDVSYLGDRGVGGDTGGGIDAGESDPYFSNVVLLMHFDGANGATNFVDVKGHAVTPMGSAALATARSVYGGASGYFDGASAYLKVAPSDDWNFAANDFTVELSVSFAGGISGQLQIPALLMLGPPLGWQLLYNRAYPPADLVPGTVLIMFSTEPGPGPVGGPQINTSPDQVVPSATWTPSADTWCHLAVVRHGSDFLFFVNGNLIGTRSLGPDGDLVDWLPGSGWESTPDGKLPLDVSINPSDGNLVIGSGLGSNGDPNPQTYFGGYIDEARITKGVARYTTNFTPPTGPFPDQ